MRIARPSGVSMMLFGLMSRCSTPFACAVWRALAILSACLTTSMVGKFRAWESVARSVRPSISSIATQIASPLSKTSKIGAMWGCESRAAARASFRKRRRSRGVFWSGREVLRATSRPSLRSRA